MFKNIKAQDVMFRALALAVVYSFGFAPIYPFVKITSYIGYPESSGFFAGAAVLAYVAINTWVFLTSVVFTVFGKKIDYLIILAVLLFGLYNYLPYLSLGLILLSASGILIGWLIKFTYNAYKKWISGHQRQAVGRSSK